MRFRRFVPLAVVATVLPAVLFVWFLHSFKKSVEDVTDVSRYPQILAQVRGNGNVNNPAVTLAHFPAAIRPAASNVRFFYRPHFLQGGTQLELRCTLPANQVNQIVATTSATTRPTNAPAKSILYTFRNATNTGFADLPGDFQIYLLGSKPDGPELEYEYGIAISLKSNEVIYWLDD